MYYVILMQEGLQEGLGASENDWGEGRIILKVPNLQINKGSALLGY